MCSLNGAGQGVCSSDRGRDRKKSDYSEEDWYLICLRSGEAELDTLCDNHHKRLYVFYQDLHPKCELHKTSKRMGTVRVTLEMYLKLRPQYPTLYPGKGLCSICFTNLAAEEKRLMTKQILDISSTSGSIESESVAGSVASNTLGDRSSSGSLFELTPRTASKADIEELNKFLATKSASINFEQLANVTYAVEKLHMSCSLVRQAIEAAAGRTLQHDLDDYQSMLQLLKDKFRSSIKSSDRVHILSVLPPEWTHRKIMSEFGMTSNHLINVTKRLVSEQGILPSLGCRVGHRLSQDVVKKVIDFYEEDEACVYVFPGKGNSYSIRVDGKKEHMQKRMLLNTLNELHSLFLKKYETEDIQISFSKFASLRPRYCLLPGGPGTHTVCVCTAHQNIQLMVEGSGLRNSTKEDIHPIKTERDCLSFIQCKPPSHECVFGQCDECPGIDPLREILELTFDLDCVEDITFQK